MQLPRQPNAPSSLSDPTSAKSINAALQAIWQQIAKVLNMNLTFGSPGNRPDNMKGAWYDDTTPGSPDTEFAVTHNLGYVPQGWIVIYQDKAASVYAGTTAWTSTQIHLKCNTASVHVRLFVIG